MAVECVCVCANAFDADASHRDAIAWIFCGVQSSHQNIIEMKQVAEIEKPTYVTLYSLSVHVRPTFRSFFLRPSLSLERPLWPLCCEHSANCCVPECECIRIETRTHQLHLLSHHRHGNKMVIDELWEVCIHKYDTSMFPKL